MTLHAMGQVQHGTLRSTSAQPADVAGLCLPCDIGADSHKDPNYTRDGLYWLGQPLFHTGLRATYQPTDQLAVKLLAVNGWNRTVDNNLGKTFEAQIGWTLSNSIDAYVGQVTLGYLSASCASDRSSRPARTTAGDCVH
jgi:hypothetical protein